MAKSPTFRIEIDGVAPDTPLSALTGQQIAELFGQIIKQLADRRTPDVQTLEKTMVPDLPDAKALENTIMLIRKFNSEVAQDSEDRYKKIPELMHAINKELGRRAHSAEE